MLCYTLYGKLHLKDNFKLANVVQSVGYYFVRDKYSGRDME